MVWLFARDNGYVLVTKDSDFADLALIQGVPPKVVWLRLGNCTTDDVERALRSAREALTEFANDTTAQVLELL